MTEKVIITFLLSIATACLAIPVAENDKNFQTLNVKDLDTAYKFQPERPFGMCLIPCYSCHDNPICATDGKTYGCPKALWCHQACGQKIDIARYGRCEEHGSSLPPRENREFKEKDILAPPREGQEY